MASKIFYLLITKTNIIKYGLIDNTYDTLLIDTY